MFRLAMIQMLVVGGKKSTNLDHAKALIKKAAGDGAKLILLPETMDLGWTHPKAKTEAGAIPDGETCQLLIKQAIQYQVYICSGLVEQDQERVYNSAVIINPKGEVILTHRKLNELDIGHDLYEQGDRLNVCTTELGTLGLMICADGFARDEVISRTLGYMGADIILSPCSWALPADHIPASTGKKEPGVDGWRKVYIPVARDFSMHIAGVSNVGWISDGPWKGLQCIGSSLLIGANGEEILQGPYGVDAEEILYADIDLTKRPARACDWEKYWGSSN